MSRIIIIVNWTLSPESIITAWIPKELHMLQSYTKIKECYTGRTTGKLIDNRLEVQYEYKIPVTNLAKMIDNDYDKCDVYWQGYYNSHLVAFDFCTRSKNKKYASQTIEEIDGIVAASSGSTVESSAELELVESYTTITTTTIHHGSSAFMDRDRDRDRDRDKKHYSHKFKVSEGIILCEQCGSTPANLIYDIDGLLPSCVG